MICAMPGREAGQADRQARKGASPRRSPSDSRGCPRSASLGLRLSRRPATGVKERAGLRRPLGTQVNGARRHGVDQDVTHGLPAGAASLAQRSGATASRSDLCPWVGAKIPQARRKVVDGEMAGPDRRREFVAWRRGRRRGRRRSKLRLRSHPARCASSRCRSSLRKFHGSGGAGKHQTGSKP
jgi:hypothetical protein